VTGHFHAFKTLSQTVEGFEPLDPGPNFAPDERQHLHNLAMADSTSTKPCVVLSITKTGGPVF
jgi:hypothetical protein